MGHSWWRQQFCAGNTSDSINIVSGTGGPFLAHHGTWLGTMLTILLCCWLHHRCGAPAGQHFSAHPRQQGTVLSLACQPLGSLLHAVHLPPFSTALQVMTELKSTLDFMSAPVEPKQWTARPVPPEFPIQACRQAAAPGS